jgi:two-component system response regulator YesN
MVVLIVDDQINIVNGIISGVNWGKVGVTKVLTQEKRIRLS